MMAPPSPELVKVSMSDGAELATHVYKTAQRRAPTLVLMIPYRKDSIFVSMIAAGFVASGFNFVAADVRGFGGSKAAYEGLWSQREQDDYVELIEWVTEQDFCNGSVGAMGASYCGGNQLLVAARKPPSLRCIAPLVGMVDTYRDWTHRGGIPSHTRWGVGTYMGSQSDATARAGLEHYYFDLLSEEFDNDAHRARSPESILGEIHTPTLCVGGWHDYFLRATVRTFISVAGPKRLIVGPWGHGSDPPIPEIMSWYGHWLRDTEGDAPGAPVRVFLTGTDRWVGLDHWPTPERCSYLAFGPGPDGSLVEGPAPDEVPARVVTHPDAVMPAPNPKPEFVPDPTDSGMSLWGEDITFDSAPLEEPLTIVGHPVLHAHVSTDCSDLDLNARLSVVKADGTCVQLTEGRLRASHRAVVREDSLLSSDGEVIVPWHPHDRAEPVPANEPVELAVEIAPVGHCFDPGDRIRLGLTLTRADEESVPAMATLAAGTRLLLPGYEA